MPLEKALVWFRRDLRDHDHAALSAALASADTVHCAFVFDTDILEALPVRVDRRVHFIHESLLELDAALRRRGGGLIVRHGRPAEEIPRLARELGAGAVFANRDYEPYAKARDTAVASALATAGIAFHSPRDQAVLDGDDVLTQSGRPFTVFTPYRNAWLKRLTDADLGFAPTDLAGHGVRPGMSGARLLWDEFRERRIGQYGALRDFPARRGVSYLSVHLRFGTLSIREAVRAARAAGADSWLNELIWRDFYFMILDRFPHVVERSFKPEFDALVWDDWPEGLIAWQEGRTGYPLVDAAMRQLRHSGWMHNRLRMVAASFLAKDLGIDWRLGERHFALQLNDFDLSANNGGWQWAASTGCDAQPYFRIFNPVTQSERFDPDGAFIRRYVPELAALPARYIHAPWRLPAAEQAHLGFVPGRDYPLPIVDHGAARERTLARYAAVRKPSP
jgi:deoxyribodipyrimidine photo-lyase